MTYMTALAMIRPFFPESLYDLKVAVANHRAQNRNWNWIEAAADLARKLESEKAK